MVKRLPGIKNTKHIVCQGRWHKHFLKANFSENLTHIIQSKLLHNYNHDHKCLDTQCSEDIQRGKDSAGIHGLPLSPADKKNFKSLTKKEINLITHHDNQMSLLKQNKTPHIFISKFININAIFLALTLPLV